MPLKHDISVHIFRHITKLWRVTIRSVMSVCPSFCLEQLGSHWIDFHEIWYLNIFQKSVKVIEVSLKSDNNNGYFT